MQNHIKRTEHRNKVEEEERWERTNQDGSLDLENYDLQVNKRQLQTIAKLKR